MSKKCIQTALNSTYTTHTHTHHSIGLFYYCARVWVLHISASGWIHIFHLWRNGNKNWALRKVYSHLLELAIWRFCSPSATAPLQYRLNNLFAAFCIDRINFFSFVSAAHTILARTHTHIAHTIFIFFFAILFISQKEKKISDECVWVNVLRWTTYIVEYY